MKFRNIRVKKAGGGYRTQRAMVLASGKLKFVKNTGGASAPRKAKHVAKRRRSSSRAITRSGGRRRSHLARMPRRRRSRRSGGGGGINYLHLGGAALGLGYLTQNVKAVADVANKIPGAKTFGPAAVIGVAALATDRFLYKNRWLKLLGVAGVVLAATQVGQKGSKMAWLGDGDEYAADIGDDGDVGDDDVGDDDVGDGLDY